MDIFPKKKFQFDFLFVFMSYLFRKIKKIKKKNFTAHLSTKKNPTSKWTFFSKKNYTLIFNVFLHLYNYYILCHIFFKNIKK